MKDRIEIGEYVRTKSGEIKRVDKIFYNKKTSGIGEYGQIIEKRKESEGYTVVDAREVVKHSKNIIDLIEVGDVIEVYFPIKQITKKVFADKYFKDSLILDGIIQKRIILKIILTKEMYEDSCYETE